MWLKGAPEALRGPDCREYTDTRDFLWACERHKLSPSLAQWRFECGHKSRVSGGSVSNEPVGWKLLRLDEATEAVVTHQKSLAPRAGYKPGDPVMHQMTCQL